MSTPPQTRYARSGDVNIAYQVLGSGPIDLVFVMGWVSERLASFSRLIIFDKRGSGIRFEDRGRRPRKGVPGDWPLFGAAA